MSKAQSRKGTTQGPNLAPWVVGFIVVVGLLVWSAWALGSILSGRSAQITWNPATAILGIVSGQLVWPAWAGVLLVAFTGSVVAGTVLVWKKVPRKSHTDKLLSEKAKVMASARDVNGITLAAVKKNAPDLFPGVDLDDSSQCGQRCGVMMDGRTAMYISWEWVATVIAGPRSGKTLSYAVPRLLEAPGPAIGTSNKPDLLSHTHLGRAEKGTVWVSDLQHISTTGGQDWWWNPLRGVSSQSGALKVASYFVTASKTDANARVDSYFDGGAQALLALMILAAARTDGDLMHVYGWLSEPNRELPSELLAASGDHVAAERLRTARTLNPRQRDGLYDMARRFVAVMEEPAYAASVLPPQRTDYGDQDATLGRIPNPKPRTGPEFLPDEFVRSCDTLYPLSMEGPDAATPLTTALVGTVFEAAVRYARESGGRLPVPMVAILDEAANVCKLGDLPSWYSHFGSQGIVVWTFLQSLPQAVSVWGNEGVDALISASNLHIYAGGAKELGGGTRYLESLSQLIGQHDVARWSTSVNSRSSGFGDRSQSQSWTKEPVFTVDELGALPSGYAIAVASGNSPIIIRKEFVTDQAHPLYDTVKQSRSSIALSTGSPAQRGVLASSSIPATPDLPRSSEIPAHSVDAAQLGTDKTVPAPSAGPIYNEEEWS